MRLSADQVRALVAWADQADDPKGLSGWGVHFDRAMQVAREVRQADATTTETPEKPSCNCHIPTGSVCDDDGCAICRFAANSGT